MENRRRWAELALLAAACVLAYAPVMTQPFIEDDYHLIGLSEKLGVPGEWRALFGNPAFLTRATSFWWLHVQHQLFATNPAGYYAGSLALHILVTWLIYLLGAWKPIGWRASFWAALFFAVYEGHQEAVMWISASNELLVCLFGLAGLECLRRSAGSGRKSAIWYALSLFCYCLALVSKESGVSWCLLYALILAADGVGGFWRRLAPFFVITIAMAWYVFTASAVSFRFVDGSFSLTAPFWWTLARSLARLHWFWGLSAFLTVLLLRRAQPLQVLRIGFAWAVVALLPYSFLTYMPHVASRHTYPASIGVAIVTAGGVIALLESSPRRAIAIALAAAMVTHNVGYLWLVKRKQFLARAAPTEQLLEFVRSRPAPVWIQCFPRPRVIAEEALRLTAQISPGDVLWSRKAAEQRGLTSAFCYQGPDRPFTSTDAGR